MSVIAFVNLGPFLVNINSKPRASGITRMSENKIALSTSKSFIGRRVTSEANSEFFIIS